MTEKRMNDPVLAKLVKLGMPCTRENYIKLAYWGQKSYEDLGVEERAELPELWDEETGSILQ
jgi:hypothetical protein